MASHRMGWDGMGMGRDRPSKRTTGPWPCGGAGSGVSCLSVCPSITQSVLPGLTGRDYFTGTAVTYCGCEYSVDEGTCGRCTLEWNCEEPVVRNAWVFLATKDYTRSSTRPHQARTRGRTRTTDSTTSSHVAAHGLPKYPADWVPPSAHATRLHPVSVSAFRPRIQQMRLCSSSLRNASCPRGCSGGYPGQLPAGCQLTPDQHPAKPR